MKPYGFRWSWMALALYLLGLVNTVGLAQQAPLRQGDRPTASDRANKRSGYSSCHALVVGVNRYDHASLSNLSNAVKDAEAVAGLLHDEFSYADGQVQLLSDDKARVDAVIAALQSLAKPGVVKATDSALVFVAGHGLVSGQRGYLALSGSQAAGAAEIEATCLAVSELVRLVRDIPCDHKLIVLDTCFSGTLFQFALPVSAPDPDAGTLLATISGGNSRGAPGPTVAASRDLLEEFLAAPAFFGLSAGNFGPVDDGAKADEHSPFTAAMLRHMRRRADSRLAGHIFTLEQLGIAVKDEVARGQRGNQIPKWGRLAVGDGEFLFVPRIPDDRETPSERQHRRHGQQIVQQGTLVADAGNLPSSLAYFAQAWLHDAAVGRTTSHHQLRWSLHARQCATPVLALDHGSTIVSAAYSPSDEIVATIGEDGYLRLWNANDGFLLRPPAELPASPRGIVFSRDGKSLAVACQDGSIAFYTTARLEREHVCQHPESNPQVIEFNHDGSRLLTLSALNAVVWDVASGQPIGSKLEHQGQVLSLARLSPDGKMAATCGILDAQLQLWKVDGAKSTKFSAWSPGRDIQDVDFRSDNRVVATGHRSGLIKFWRPEDGVEFGGRVNHREAITGLRYSHDGRFITVLNAAAVRTLYVSHGLTFVADERERLINCDRAFLYTYSPNQRRFVSWAGHAAFIRDRGSEMTPLVRIETGKEVVAACFSSDGRHVFGLIGPAATVATGIVRASRSSSNRHVWSAEDGTPSQYLGQASRILWLSGNGEVALAFDLMEKSFQLVDCTTGTARNEPLPDLTPEVPAIVVFSRHNRRLATLGGDGVATFWQRGQAQPISQWKLGPSPIPITLSPGGDRAAILEMSHPGVPRIRLWDVDGSAELAWDVPEGNQIPQFDPSGKLIALAQGSSVGLFDLLGKDLTEEAPRHDEPVISLAFHPDGAVIASGDTSGAVVEWQSQSGLPRRRPLRDENDEREPVFFAHQDDVSWIEYSPAGDLLVTVHRGGAAQVWHRDSDQPVSPLLRHLNSNIVHATFSPGGERLATTAEDGSICIWDLSMDDQPPVDAVRRTKVFLQQHWSDHVLSTRDLSFSQLVGTEALDAFNDVARLYRSSLDLPRSRQKAWHLQTLADCDHYQLKADAALQCAALHALDRGGPWLSKQAEYLLNLQKWSAALPLLDRLVVSKPDHWNFRQLRGLAHLGLGRFDEALTDFNRVTELAPTEPSGWLGLGSVHSQRKQWSEADTAFEKALTLQTDPSARRTTLGQAAVTRVELKRWPQAAAAFDEAAQLALNAQLPDVAAELWENAALARLAGRQIPEFTAARAELLRQFSDSREPRIGARLLWLHGLTADGAAAWGNKRVNYRLFGDDVAGEDPLRVKYNQGLILMVARQQMSPKATSTGWQYVLEALAREQKNAKVEANQITIWLVLSAAQQALGKLEEAKVSFGNAQALRQKIMSPTWQQLVAWEQLFQDLGAGNASMEK